MRIHVRVCCVWLYVCICMWLVCVQGPTWHSRPCLMVCQTARVLNCLFLWKDSVNDISVTADPFLFSFSALPLPLYNCDWGREPGCPVVKKWKRVIISSPHSAQTCYMWHSVFIGICPCSAYGFTPSFLLPFPFPPPTSLLHFLPPPFPRLPSSVCFCSLDSLSVPTSTLSLSNYSPSLSLLCLPDCKKEDGE